MSETFQAQLIEARRNLIIDAAIEAISEQGFQRTTIKQIAAKAGIADGTIYNYFRSKDDILMGIVARLSEGEARDLDLADSEQTDFAAFIENFVGPRMEEMDSLYEVLRAVVPEMLTNAEFGNRLFDQIYGPIYAVVEHYFQQLIGDEQIEAVDPASAARLFASPFLGLIVLRMMGDDHIAANWDNYTEMLSRLLLKAFEKETAAAGGSDTTD